jgi:hypothetical protein
VNDNEIRIQAEIIFNHNMENHGFSFSPEGLFRAAFNEGGQPYKNWKLKMRLHQPTPAEHPKLYEPPRYIDERRKMHG